jgi:phage tail protein X
MAGRKSSDRVLSKAETCNPGPAKNHQLIGHGTVIYWPDVDAEKF